MAYRKHSRKKSFLGSKNRRWSDTHHTWAVPTKFTGLIILAVICGMVYSVVVHARASLWDEIGRAEQTNRQLSEDLAREQVRWDDMRSAPKLREALAKNGISMKIPQGRQVIAMGGPNRHNGRNAASGAYAANR